MDGEEDSHLSIFPGEVLDDNGRYVIEIPDAIGRTPADHAETTYRVAIISDEEEPVRISDRGTNPRDQQETNAREPTAERTAPVSEGETHTVTIRSDGDRGDGVAKVSGGFVVFVPDASVGEELLVQITNVEGTYAQADIIKRLG